jgi:hypothetical protein
MQTLSENGFSELRAEKTTAGCIIIMVNILPEQPMADRLSHLLEQMRQQHLDAVAINPGQPLLT